MRAATMTSGVKVAVLSAVAAALLACGPQPTTKAHAGSRPQGFLSASAPAETSAPPRPSPIGAGARPPGQSPVDDPRAQSAEPFAAHGRCRSFWVPGYPARASVSGKVLGARRTDERVRSVRIRDAAGTEVELRFDCEPSHGPPVAPGEVVRAELECSTVGWAPACRGLLTTSGGQLLMATRRADLARSGLVVQDGPLVSERSYMSRGKERVFALRVRHKGTEVVTRPHEWVTLTGPDESFHLFGWASRWTGMRPPDADNFFIVVATRAFGDR
jgi:hypothetical protein